MENTEKRLALIGIVVKDRKNISLLNNVLGEYHECIIGRMGIPHRQGDVNLISVAVEAPMPVINALSGKLGRIEGVSSKVIMA